LGLFTGKSAECPALPACRQAGARNFTLLDKIVSELVIVKILR
jgi:hypothetical protein